MVLPIKLKLDYSNMLGYMLRNGADILKGTDASLGGIVNKISSIFKQNPCISKEYILEITPDALHVLTDIEKKDLENMINFQNKLEFYSRVVSS